MCVYFLSNDTFDGYDVFMYMSCQKFILFFYAGSPMNEIVRVYTWSTRFVLVILDLSNLDIWRCVFLTCTRYAFIQILWLIPWPFFLCPTRMDFIQSQYVLSHILLTSTVKTGMLKRWIPLLTQCRTYLHRLQKLFNSIERLFPKLVNMSREHQMKTLLSNDAIIHHTSTFVEKSFQLQEFILNNHKNQI